MPLIFERIYEYTTFTGATVGLYKRTASSDFPYIIKRNNKIVCEVEYLGDANREYHNQIAREECPF